MRCERSVECRPGAYSNLAIATAASAPILVANYDSATHPMEIVRIDQTTGERRLLTNFNVARAANIDLAPLRHFWFTSSRGKKIHSMMVVPPNFDESKKYPLFVVMHGGPHSMWRDQWVTRWNYHLLAQPGYVVLLTNYTGSTGYGEKFAQEIQGDPLAGPASEINEAADYAIKQYPFHRCEPAGGGRRELRRSPGQLDAGEHDALQMPDQPCRSDQSRVSMGYQRHHLSS